MGRGRRRRPVPTSQLHISAKVPPQLGGPAEAAESLVTAMTYIVEASECVRKILGMWKNCKRVNRNQVTRFAHGPRVFRLYALFDVT